LIFRHCGVDALRRAEILPGKINLLLDVIMSDSGKPFDFPGVRDSAKALTGYELSRTRWSMLKNSHEQVVPEKTLCAIAAVFDVNPEYLLQMDGALPDHVAAKLELIRNLRLSDVLNFAGRTLGPVDPEGFRVIADAIAKMVNEGP
jgi:hypothetical protein